MCISVAEKVQFKVTETELPVGSSGGIYPLLGPDLPSQIQVGTEEVDKTNPDNTCQLTDTSELFEKVVAGNVDGNSGDNTDLGETVCKPLFMKGEDDGKGLPEEKEQGTQPSLMLAVVQSLFTV